MSHSLIMRASWRLGKIRTTTFSNISSQMTRQPHFLCRTKDDRVFGIHRSLICFCVVMKLKWNRTEQAEVGGEIWEDRLGCLWKLSGDIIDSWDDEINKVTSMAVFQKLAVVNSGYWRILGNCDFVVGKTNSSSCDNCDRLSEVPPVWSCAVALSHHYGRQAGGEDR